MATTGQTTNQAQAKDADAKTTGKRSKASRGKGYKVKPGRKSKRK